MSDTEVATRAGDRAMLIMTGVIVPPRARIFDEVLASIPYSKTFEINGTERT